MIVISVICTLMTPHYPDPLTLDVSSPANPAGVMSHKSCQIVTLKSKQMLKTFNQHPVQYHFQSDKILRVLLMLTQLATLHTH